MQFVNAVFYGCARQNKSVTAAQALDGLRGFGTPVFDPLGFVENDNVRRKARIYIKRVGNHLFVVDDGEKWRGRMVVITLEAADFAAEDKLQIQGGEFSYLLLPFGFEGSGGDHQ